MKKLKNLRVYLIINGPPLKYCKWYNKSILFNLDELWFLHRRKGKNNHLSDAYIRYCSVYILIIIDEESETFKGIVTFIYIILKNITVILFIEEISQIKIKKGESCFYPMYLIISCVILMILEEEIEQIKGTICYQVVIVLIHGNYNIIIIQMNKRKSSVKKVKIDYNNYAI